MIELIDIELIRTSFFEGNWPCVSRKNASQHIACQDCGIEDEVLSVQKKVMIGFFQADMVKEIAFN